MPQNNNEDLIEQIKAVYPDYRIEVMNDKIYCSGYVAFPINRGIIESASTEIEIKNIEDVVIGYICLCRDGQKHPTASFSEMWAAALVDEVRAFPPEEYVFSFDYLVLKQEFVNIYNTEYKDLCSVWGGFLHIEQQITGRKYNTTAPIIARLLRVQIPEQKENLIRATLTPYTFERYLKYYHCLEILFDWIVVERIRALSTDIKEFGNVMKDYRGDEYSKLVKTIQYFGLTDSEVESLLYGVQISPDVADKLNIICNEYGKESNPLVNKWAGFIDLVQRGSLNVVELKRANLVNSNENYSLLIRKVLCYWIYRIRSCIAHNKVGEYLMTMSDEEFMLQFGEPLVFKLLNIIMSKP